MYNLILCHWIEVRFKLRNFTAFSFLNECLLALLTTDTDEQCSVKLKTTNIMSVRKSLISL